MSRSNPFERGQKAKRAGRLLESNPFAKRDGNGNRRRANEWALGWHSVEARARVESDWKWPPLRDFPRPQAGDYGMRERGLDALFRPVDPIEWDVFRTSMVAQVVGDVPDRFVIPYELLRQFGEERGHTIGEVESRDVEWVGHPLKYLWSACRIQGPGLWPILIVSAFEELKKLQSAVPSAVRGGAHG